MVQADWHFLINEAALDLVVTTFDTAPLAIMVLGTFNVLYFSDMNTGKSVPVVYLYSTLFMCILFVC